MRFNTWQHRNVNENGVVDNDGGQVGVDGEIRISNGDYNNEYWIMFANPLINRTVSGITVYFADAEEFNLYRNQLSNLLTTIPQAASYVSDIDESDVPYGGFPGVLYPSCVASEKTVELNKPNKLNRYQILKGGSNG